MLVLIKAWELAWPDEKGALFFVMKIMDVS